MGAPIRAAPREGRSVRAILNALRPYCGIRCPVLVLFAVLHRRGGLADAEAVAKDLARVEPLVKHSSLAFRKRRSYDFPMPATMCSAQMKLTSFESWTLGS